MRMGKPDLRGAGVGSAPEGGRGGRGGRPGRVRRVGRGCAQATGQKGSHEGGGGIAHQSAACIPTETKVSRGNMVRIRGAHLHCDHDQREKKRHQI